MDPFVIAGIACGLIALVVVALSDNDGWFFGLLAMACLLGSTSEVFKDHRFNALVFLLFGTLFAGVALRAVFAARRARKG
ncbi:hypothetical protein AB0F46_41355 [Streptomyces sp. NPDC026665]|uniref:hypothetical protein n=1 Tax=Streptomyces sp. NPDC026665 TaxID=3154798 RepID=UPI003403D145